MLILTWLGVSVALGLLFTVGLVPMEDVEIYGWQYFWCTFLLSSFLVWFVCIPIANMINRDWKIQKQKEKRIQDYGISRDQLRKSFKRY